MSVDDEDRKATREELAAERRAIAMRSDNDWASYGFDDAYRDEWIAAGIPADRAPAIAIAQHVGAEGYNFIKPQLLDLDLDDEGDTVRAMLLRGENSAVLERALTARLGEDIGLGVTSWLGLLVPPVNIRPLSPLDAKQLRATDTHPSRVIAFRETIGPWVGEQGPLTFAITKMQAAADLVLADPALIDTREDADPDSATDPRMGFHMVATVAASHGVMIDDFEMLQRIAAAFPRDENVFSFARAGIPTFGMGDRYHFHANASHHRALQQAAEMQELPGQFNPRALPADAGFGYLAGDDQTPAELLAWGRSIEGRFAAALWNVDEILSGASSATLGAPAGVRVFVDELRSTTSEPVTPTNEDEAEVISVLMAFIEVMEQRGEADAAAEPQAMNKNQRRRDAKLARRGDRPIALIYARGVNAGQVVEPRGRREHAYRWPVRGFWRRQWYASLQAHRLIWIEEHTRGPADKPLRDSAPQVHVLRTDDAGSGSA